MPQQPQMTPEQFAELEPEKVLLTMRIIAGALMMGVIIFGLIVAMQFNGNQPNPGQPQVPQRGIPDLLTYIGAGMALLMILLRFTIPPLVARTLIRQIRRNESTGTRETLGRLLMAAQTKMIIEYAMLEGAAFFNLIAVMTEHSMISIGVVIVLLSLMLLNFPTMNKLVNWIEQQSKMLIAD